MSKADKLAQALDALLEASPEIEASAVVSSDGLPMASALPSHVQEDRLAAMSAALLTLGDRAAEGLGKGSLAQVFVEGENGHVILMSAGPDAVLVGVVSKGSKIGLVLYEMRRSAERVKSVMLEDGSVSEPPPPVGIANDPYQAEQHPVRAPEPIPAAEVVQPSVSAWE
ncbi:MAG: roadblock/LC7 domain-containing protein [Actinomycetota bacterium]